MNLLRKEIVCRGKLLDMSACSEIQQAFNGQLHNSNLFVILRKILVSL